MKLVFVDETGDRTQKDYLGICVAMVDAMHNGSLRQGFQDILRKAGRMTRCAGALTGGIASPSAEVPRPTLVSLLPTPALSCFSWCPWWSVLLFLPSARFRLRPDGSGLRRTGCDLCG